MSLPTISLIVTEQLYSSLGQACCKTVPVINGNNNILGFVNTLIAIRNPLNASSNWPTGGPLDTNSDVVNWAWPNNSAITDTDRQYAYQGSFPEGDPLQRKVQSSQPGQVFSIQGDIGSANHSTSYTPGYLPTGVDTVLPDLLLDNDSTASLYTQLSCGGNEMNIGSLGAIRRAQVRDFKGKTLAKTTVDDDGNNILTTTLYLLGAQFNSGVGQAFMNEQELYLPNYYSLSDTGQVVSTDTNALGQHIAQNLPDSGTTLNYYDGYGRLRFSQTADQATAGTVIYYLYDPLTRLLESGFLAMAWDSNTFQALTSATDASQLPSKVTPQPLRQWAYDQSMADDDGSYVLETIGKIMQVTSWNTMLNGKSVVVNPNSQLVEQYTYDYLGRCKNFTQTLNAGTSYTTRYTYDSLGRIATLTYPQAASNTNPFTLYRSYTIQNKLSALGTTDNPSAYASYKYNEFGQVTQENLGANGQGVSYTYGNTLNQLTAYSDTYQLISASLSYTDSSGSYQDGNIQQISYQFDTSILNLNNDPIQSYTYTYSYDTFGRLTAAVAQNADSSANSAWSMSSISNDANNNLRSYILNSTTNIYAYPAGKNQVKNINGGTSFNYSDSGLTLSTPNSLSFTYDLLIPLPTAVSSASDTLSFIYNTRGERYQKNDSNSNTTLTYLRGTHGRPLVEITIGASSGTLYYIYGAKGLAMITDGSNNYVVLKDHLGSARIVHQDVAASNLAASNIAGYFNYLPYGSLIADNSQQNSALLTCRYLYAGQEWDSELVLYNYHARQYDPALGRFYTPDPAHQFASPYCYVGNNPINYYDQTGQLSLPVNRVPLNIQSDKKVEDREAPPRYFTVQEREALKVQVNGRGELTANGGQAILEDEQNYHYVVSLQGDLYAYNNNMGFIPKSGEEVKHSSFFGSEDNPVLMAGYFGVEKGRINYINNGSGHYQPATDLFEIESAHLFQRGFLDENTLLRTDGHSAGLHYAGGRTEGELSFATTLEYLEEKYPDVPAQSSTTINHSVQAIPGVTEATSAENNITGNRGFCGGCDIL